ncbi:uncharacterized protein LOC143289345 [Babylonia areolata]|uniref:uncharacterized protein LOC143289345 n=1 Tax=Babylonia areolata TaxID=304850 RepID=UPI003FD42247
MADVTQRGLETEEGKETLVAIIQFMETVRAMQEPGEQPVADAIQRVLRFFYSIRYVCAMQEAAGEQFIADVIDRALETEEGRQILMALVQFVKKIIAVKETGKQLIADATPDALQVIRLLRNATKEGENSVVDAIHRALETEEGREALMVFMKTVCLMQEAGARLFADVTHNDLETEEGKEALKDITQLMGNIMTMREAEQPVADFICDAFYVLKFTLSVGNVCAMQEAAEHFIADFIDRALGTEEGRKALMAIITFMKSIKVMKVAGEDVIADAVQIAVQTTVTS